MTSTTSAEDIAKQFDALIVTEQADELLASYNVAPTQQIMVVADHKDERRVETMRWGLVPFFAKDSKGGARMINARAENVAEKPAYRRAFKKRRCIIPADGFYEWQKIDSKTKQPWFFHPKNTQMLAFAGLWEVWHDPQLPEDADPLITATIITTDANKDMDEVHNRMPLILSPTEIEAWLDVNNEDLSDLKHILEAPVTEKLTKYPISTEVNKASNNGPELLEPLKPQ